MRRTLVIGIGGSGVKIGCALKRRLFSFYDDPETTRRVKESVRFLFFENDSNEFVRGQMYAGNEYSQTDVVKLDGPNPDEYVKKAKLLQKAAKRPTSPEDADLLSWIDVRANFRPGISDIGLAANRQQGRLASYVNWNKIRDRVKNAITQLKGVGGDKEAGKGESVSVYMIASICGGTGSSIFADVATIVDSVHKEAAETKQAILLAPGFFLSRLIGKGESDELYMRYQTNAWAFMSEVEYFQFCWASDPSAMARFSARPSDLAASAHEDVKQTFTPFRNAYLFDYRTSNGGEILPESYYEVVAGIMCETIAGSNQDALNSALVNERDRGKPEWERKHRTLTMTSLEFPTAEYREYFESRFLYEVVGNHLLRKSMTGAETVAIEKEATALAKRLANETLTASLSNLEGQWHDFQEVALLIKASADSAFADKPGSNQLTTNPDAVCQRNETILGEYKAKIEAQLKDHERYYNFSRQFGPDLEPPDRLRTDTWQAVADVVRKLGYYAVVGWPEVRGFLDFLKHELKKLRDEAKFNLSELDSRRSALSAARLTAQRQISAFTSKLLRQKLADASVKKAIASYRANINESAEIERSIALARMRLLVLEAFAGRAADNSHGWLGTYHVLLREAVGPSSSGKSLAQWFDDGLPSGNSVKATFWQKLPAKFGNSKKEVFRIRIPFEPYDLVQGQEWLSDSGPSPNPLGALYANNVVVSTDTMQKIFGEPKDPLGPNTVMLSGIAGKAPDEILADALSMGEMVRSWFVTNMLTTEKAPLNKFLSMNIIDAHKMMVDLHGHDAERKQAEGRLIERLTSLPLALNFQMGVPSGLSRTPFVSVDKEQAFVDFATNKLGFEVASVIRHEFAGSKTKISVLHVVDNVRFADLTDSQKMHVVYKGRGLDWMRPHIVARWNDNADGPWDGVALSANALRVSVGGSEYTIDPEERLLLALMMDGLRTGKGSKSVSSSLFITDPKLQRLLGVLPQGPISLDKISGKFKIGTQFEIRRATAAKPTAGKRAGGGAAVGERFGVSESSLEDLPLSFTTPAIDETLKAVTSPARENLFREFFRVVIANRKIIGETLAANSAGASVIEQFIEEEASARRAGRPFEERDAEFVRGMYAKYENLSKRLFNA